MTEFSGLLPVFKPTGMTSRDASRVLIRRHGVFKFGHVGTLDPDADGVLPVLLGNATKLQDYLLEMPKSYRFIITLGTATTTLDASGDVTESKSWDHVTRDAVLEHMSTFQGQIRQVPPLFSAVKMKGKELYKHARNGQSSLSDDEKQQLIRTVTVYNIDLVRMTLPELELTVRCSKGTYIRTIADDLARCLGTVGHVTFLRRELSAGFDLAECHTLETLTAPDVTIEQFLIPMQRIAIGLPVWQPSDILSAQRLLNGQILRCSQAEFLNECVGCSAVADESGPQRFLIRDIHGNGIGIGDVTNVYSSDQQQVMIHLKRGL